MNSPPQTRIVDARSSRRPHLGALQTRELGSRPKDTHELVSPLSRKTISGTASRSVVDGQAAGVSLDSNGVASRNRLGGASSSSSRLTVSKDHNQICSSDGDMSIRRSKSARQSIAHRSNEASTTDTAKYRKMTSRVVAGYAAEYASSPATDSGYENHANYGATINNRVSHEKFMSGTLGGLIQTTMWSQLPSCHSRGESTDATTAWMKLLNPAEAAEGDSIPFVEGLVNHLLSQIRYGPIPPTLTPSEITRLPVSSTPAGDCVICQEAHSSEAVRLECAHSFHAQCIGAWMLLNASCPVCRYEVTVPGGLNAPTLLDGLKRIRAVGLL
ncbi:hypothetical protein BC830DRAFT_810258 [Chytriomyces sp. MP71]|nr:hypothetical protein BC830DRAFT_810258 [Chytriomyces sp. MP71]